MTNLFNRQRPTASDSKVEAGLVLNQRCLEQHRRVEELDVDPNITDGFDRVGDLDQLAAAASGLA